ncbi:MAG: DUF2752 domain-containing protein, partial [Acidimicrobiia bacterium]
MTTAPRTGRLTEPLMVGAIGAAALIAIDPPDEGIPWCPSALMFGVACPLCGLTRGVARFVRGDIASSIGFHPMAWLVFGVVALAWGAWFGRRAGWWTWRSPIVEKWILAVLGIGLVAA